MLVQRFMEAAAFLLGLAALVLLFAPELALARFAIEPSPGALPLAQLYGAALFGLAMTAWMARTMLLGGIYGRAIVTGGFAHSFAGAFVLVHAIRTSPGNSFLWAACVLYALLALAFGTLMFGRGPAAPASIAAP
jgi:hypothetical protein